MQENKGLGGNAAEEGKAERGFQKSGAREGEKEVETEVRGKASRSENAANGATRFTVQEATPERRAQIPSVSSGSAHFTIPGGSLGGGQSSSLEKSLGGNSLGRARGAGCGGSLVIDGSYFQTSSEALALLSLARRVHVVDDQKWRKAEEDSGVGDLSVSAAVSGKEDPRSGRRKKGTSHPESDSESSESRTGSEKSSLTSAISLERGGSDEETEKSELNSGTEVETGSPSRSEGEEEGDHYGGTQRGCSAVAERRSRATRTTRFSSSKRTFTEEEEQQVDGPKSPVSRIKTRNSEDSSSDQSDGSSVLTDTSNILSPILEDTEEERSSSSSDDEEEEDGHLKNESAD